MPPSHTDEGIRLADELRTTQPAVGVVVLSQHTDPLYALALFGGGAGGRAYLLKERVRDRTELGRCWSWRSRRRPAAGSRRRFCISRAPAERYGAEAAGGRFIDARRSVSGV
jgi:hypothetical protein